MKVRLDELLVRRGLAASRTQAKALVMAGRAWHGTERLDKPGREYPEDFAVELAQPPRFVGRGGEKLAAAIERWGIDVRGAHALDIGASTGGFTDCLLQAGAADVTCVDVGHGQLHARLRADPRVANLERLNARHLRPGDLPRDGYDLVVMDLAFISLKVVLPAVWSFLRSGGVLIALVKPQFEVGRAEASRGRGVVRDRSVQDAVLAEITAFALAALPGAALHGTMDSPIAGADGNRELLLVLDRRG